MNSTKKMPIPIWLPSGRTGRQFLIPCFNSEQKSGFQGLSNGKRYMKGTLVFIGLAITAEDIFERLLESRSPEISKQDFIALLDRYVGALQEFKIGNVVSISYLPDGTLALRKEIDTPPVKPLRLP